jgi:hypothetical protein
MHTCLHRYADDDTIINNPDVTLDAWWHPAKGAQRLYMSSGHRINRRRPRLANNWEEAMSHMAALLDQVGIPSPPPPPPPSTSWWQRAAHQAAPPPPPLLQRTAQPPPPPQPLWPPSDDIWPPATPCPVAPPPRPTNASAPPPTPLCTPFLHAHGVCGQRRPPGAHAHGNDSSAPPPQQQQQQQQQRRSARVPPRLRPPNLDRQRLKGLVRFYARPQHMPVLFSRMHARTRTRTRTAACVAPAELCALVRRALSSQQQRAVQSAARHRARGTRVLCCPRVPIAGGIVYELEARWPDDFARTRRNKLRRSQEIELNFFYHHYLRVQRYPTLSVSSDRIEFLFAQRCARPEGERRCAKLIRTRNSDFVTFNDDATTRATLDAGLNSLHRILRADYGTF